MLAARRRLLLLEGGSRLGRGDAATTMPMINLARDCCSARNAPRVGGLSIQRVASQSANGLYASINASHATANPTVASHDVGAAKPTCRMVAHIIKVRRGGTEALRAGSLREI